MRRLIVVLTLTFAATELYAQQPLLVRDTAAQFTPVHRIEAEARIKKFIAAVLGGFSEDAADFVAYPLIVELPDRKKLIARDRRAFIRQWDKIFSKSFVKYIRDRQPVGIERDELHPFCSVANGTLWFGALGNLQRITQKPF